MDITKKNTLQQDLSRHTTNQRCRIFQKIKNFLPREKFFRKFPQAIFWRKSSVLLSIERSTYSRRKTWLKNLLDKAMVYSNVTWLLHLRIRDPELHCHECIGSGLKQHSHRQLRFWSQDRQSAEISEFLVHHVRKKSKQSLSLLFLSSATI